MIRKALLITAVVALIAAASATDAEALGALTVTVENSQGNPVQGARVTITGPSGEGVQFTDKFGEADFDYLAEGWYDIEVMKNGATVYDQVYVDDGKRRRHTIIL